MLYRINYRNFLLYAIDYFTREELDGLYFIIISAKVLNQGRRGNVFKMNDLYPDVSTIETFANTGDISILEKMYESMIDTKTDKNMYAAAANNNIYQIVKSVESRMPVVLLSSDDENECAYITALCNVIKCNFSLDVINLDELFTKGKVGPYRIDYNKIHDKLVPLSRAVAKEKWKDVTSTSDGKAKVIAGMSKKEKLKWLKKFDINITENDMSHIDDILLQAWEENG